MESKIPTEQSVKDECVPHICCTTPSAQPDTQPSAQPSAQPSTKRSTTPSRQHKRCQALPILEVPSSKHSSDVITYDLTLSYMVLGCLMLTALYYTNRNVLQLPTKLIIQYANSLVLPWLIIVMVAFGFGTLHHATVGLGWYYTLLFLLCQIMLTIWFMVTCVLTPEWSNVMTHPIAVVDMTFALILNTAALGIIGYQVTKFQ